MFAKFLFAAVPLLSGEYLASTPKLILTTAVMAIDGCTREATVLQGDTCDAICEWTVAIAQTQD